MPSLDLRMTRDAIIKAAFRRIGIKRPSADQIATEGIEALMLAILEVDQEGKYLWTIDNTESEIELALGERSYTVGVGDDEIPDGMLALETFELYSGGQYTPLEILTKDESLTTTLREGTGQPVAVFLEVKANPSENVLHVFQTPNADLVARFTFRRFLQGFSSPSEKGDFPPKFNRAVILSTAEILAGEFGAPDLGDIVAQKDAAIRKATGKVAGPTRTSRPQRIQDF